MKTKRATQIVKNIVWHRNGMSGLSFHVAIVEETEQGETRKMLVIRMDKEADQKMNAIACAAFDLDKLGQENIEFGENSWRGEHFVAAMDKAIETL